MKMELYKELIRGQVKKQPADMKAARVDRMEVKMNIQNISGYNIYQSPEPTIRRRGDEPPESNPDAADRAAGKDEPEREPDYDSYIPGDASNRKEKTQKSESCTANTDKVDREIERLKKKKAQLEQQARTAADPSRREALEKQLAQVERELAQKDNDGYRRAHTSFS